MFDESVILYTVGMTKEQAVTMAKKLGFSEECIDEVTLLIFHP